MLRDAALRFRGNKEDDECDLPFCRTPTDESASAHACGMKIDWSFAHSIDGFLSLEAFAICMRDCILIKHTYVKFVFLRLEPNFQAYDKHVTKQAAYMYTCTSWTCIPTGVQVRIGPHKYRHVIHTHTNIYYTYSSCTYLHVPIHTYKIHTVHIHTHTDIITCTYLQGYIHTHSYLHTHTHTHTHTNKHSLKYGGIMPVCWVCWLLMSWWYKWVS